jgi:hypothetical protein
MIFERHRLKNGRVFCNRSVRYCNVCSKLCYQKQWNLQRELSYVYTLRLIVYDSFSGVCHWVNTRKLGYIWNFFLTKRQWIMARALILIRQNTNRTRLIVACKRSFTKAKKRVTKKSYKTKKSKWEWRI